jgi:hypothetical protein
LPPDGRPPTACDGVKLSITSLLPDYSRQADRRLALAEARRILKPAGRLALKGYTAEDASSLWILDYFPE